MEVEKTEFSKTEEEIASVGASNGVDEQVLFTTQNKDRINFVDMNNGSYMIIDLAICLIIMGLIYRPLKQLLKEE